MSDWIFLVLAIVVFVPLLFYGGPSMYRYSVDVVHGDTWVNHNVMIVAIVLLLLCVVFALVYWYNDDVEDGEIQGQPRQPRLLQIPSRHQIIVMANPFRQPRAASKTSKLYPIGHL